MKRALVSGANRGIGLQICKDLAEKGYEVFLGARDLSSGEKAAASINNGMIIPIELDVANSLSIQKTFEKLKKLDVLLNNAGILKEDKILGGSLEAFENSWRVHVIGPLELAKAFMPGMNDRGYGRIVNVSSAWGSFGQGLGGPPAYSISKAALNALTINLAREASKGVLVNSVCPGWVRTDMGGKEAARSVEEGSKGIVYLATLKDDGPNGGFFRDGQAISF